MEKESDKEKMRFLEISTKVGSLREGSAAELITQIYIGIEIKYIDKTIGLNWVTELNEILGMLTGLKSSFK